jgi:hypothetical protein
MGLQSREVSTGRVSERPTCELEQARHPSGHEQARTVLRHLASEINRHTSEPTAGHSSRWEDPARPVVQAEARRYFGSRLSERDVGFGVILTLVVQPMIVSLGWSIDFVPRNPAPPQMPASGCCTGPSRTRWRSPGRRRFWYA